MADGHLTTTFTAADGRVLFKGEIDGGGRFVPPSAGAAAASDTPPEDDADASSAIAGGRIKSFVERIERLEEDKRAIADDLKLVFAEAKGEGFDVKILRKVVRLRGQDKVRRDEEEALLDLYIAAIGGL